MNLPSPRQKHCTIYFIHFKGPSNGGGGGGGAYTCYGQSWIRHPFFFFFNVRGWVSQYLPPFPLPACSSSWFSRFHSCHCLIVTMLFVLFLFPWYPIGESSAAGFGEWSSWSPCSTSCGGGKRERTRPCGLQCRTTERQECNKHICSGG